MLDKNIQQYKICLTLYVLAVLESESFTKTERNKSFNLVNFANKKLIC